MIDLAWFLGIVGAYLVLDATDWKDRLIAVLLFAVVAGIVVANEIMQVTP